MLAIWANFSENLKRKSLSMVHKKTDKLDFVKLIQKFFIKRSTKEKKKDKKIKKQKQSLPCAVDWLGGDSRGSWL